MELKINLKIAVSIHCFRQRPQQVRLSAYCNVTLNVLTVTDEDHKR